MILLLGSHPALNDLPLGEDWRQEAGLGRSCGAVVMPLTSPRSHWQEGSELWRAVSWRQTGSPRQGRKGLCQAPSRPQTTCPSPEGHSPCTLPAQTHRQAQEDTRPALTARTSSPVVQLSTSAQRPAIYISPEREPEPPSLSYFLLLVALITSSAGCRLPP